MSRSLTVGLVYLGIGLLLATTVPNASGQAPPLESTAVPPVVINEIMYHPAGDRDELQFLELHNPGQQVVDLSGWAFTQGVEYTFARGTTLPAGGYLVICRDITALKTHYGPSVPIAGAYTGSLSHKGEVLILSDAQGRPREQIGYSDRSPWPAAADGYGSSLERICPNLSGTDPANWNPSPTGSGRKPGGTPGAVNSLYSLTPLPTISQVHLGPRETGKPITAFAAVHSQDRLEAVILAWNLPLGEQPEAWTDAIMQRQSGPPNQELYTAQIPEIPTGQFLRYKIRARTASGQERWQPAKTALIPFFSAGSLMESNTAWIPFLKLYTSSPVERSSSPGRVRRLIAQRLTRATSSSSTWTSTALYLPPGTPQSVVFDNVDIRPRKGGYKVSFHEDQPLEGMTDINLIFEASPRYVLAEPLAYEVYRRAGVLTPNSSHVRLWLDDKPLGYYLLVEQPNRAFLRRQGRNDAGNLYKLLWYEHGVEAQHEKKSNLGTSHQDLLQVLHGLEQFSGNDQWDFIQQHFRVEEMLSYFAASMCIQNWDGFWNNYFAYHDSRPGGKWELIPWDEDKTWGDYDGASRQYDWYEMPLTFGMKGDRATGGSWFGGGPFGGVSWWRPPGYFSGPLLANPEFRRRFLIRLAALCQSVFTPEVMGPVIREMEKRLEPEVKYRAELKRQNPESVLRQFRSDIQSFHNQIQHRREYLQQELASAQAGPADR